MTYNMQSRLRYNSDRFNDINREYIRYYRGADIIEFYATRILNTASQLIVGAGVTRIEVQDWGIDIANIDFGDEYNLPLDTDRIRRANGDFFVPIQISADNPPWEFVTSARDRVLLHTVRHTDSSLPPP